MSYSKMVKFNLKQCFHYTHPVLKIRMISKTTLLEVFIGLEKKIFVGFLNANLLIIASRASSLVRVIVVSLQLLGRRDSLCFSTIFNFPSVCKKKYH